jgi:hypothetical protein
MFWNVDITFWCPFWKTIGQSYVAQENQ